MLQERGARRGDETGRRRRRLLVVSGPHLPVGPAAVLAAGALLETVIRGASQRQTGSSGVLLTSAFLAVGATAPLSFLAPFGAATAVVAAAVLALTITGALPVASAVAVVLAMYRLGTDVNASRGTARVRRLSGAAAGALSVPFPVIALSVSRTSDAGVAAVLLTALAPAAAFAGNAAHARSEARVHQAAREAVARSLVEHTARGERARIARELHDVVAHHMSMIAIQAEAAPLKIPDLPPAAQETLAAIRGAAREALGETRRVVGLLRNGDELPERVPQPGLARLDELVEAARQSGLSVEPLVVGVPRPLAVGVDLSAYRIVQEAMSNAARYAPGSRIRVAVHYGGQRLRVSVTDDGSDAPGPTQSGGGHGLVGMRERVAMLGGTLSAGPSDGGGFEVVADLPYGDAPQPA